MDIVKIVLDLLNTIVKMDVLLQTNHIMAIHAADMVNILMEAFVLIAMIIAFSAKLMQPKKHVMGDSVIIQLFYW